MRQSLADKGSTVTNTVGDIDINLLRALDALLSERSLTRAGQGIGLSPPGMSAALRRLRAHFHDDLLVRRGRNYSLTPLAERLAPLASDAMEAAAGLLGAENSFDPSESTKRFTISLSEYAMTVLAEPLSRAFRDRAPGCSIAFDAIPTDSRRTERQLMSRDMLVGATGFGLPGVVEPLFHDRIVCIVDERNPVAASGTLTLDEVQSLPRAVAEIGARDRIRRRFEDAEAEAALGEGRVRIVVSSLLTLPFVVSGTDMCGFVPARLAASCPAGLRLRVVETPLPQRDIVEAMHWHPTRAHDASAAWLRNLLHDIADQLGDVGT